MRELGAIHYRIKVKGLVQGVGFRPTVTEAAEDAHILGYVQNLGGEVLIIASGTKDAMDTFLFELHHLAVGQVESYEETELRLLEETEESLVLSDVCEHTYTISKVKFEIKGSASEGKQRRFLPVDIATCEICKQELFYPKNRRYRYPFISCTQCGPRYSIQKRVPYDRESTTMDVFSMCEACENEYTRKYNVRRHAQTISCHNCGPQLRMIISDREIKETICGDFREYDKEGYVWEHATEDILRETIRAMKDGKIVALKDIGGFHFAFSVYDENAAKRLRRFKNRDNKPFAVMFDSIEAIKEYCHVSEAEEKLLLSPARPIVLLDKRKKEDFAPEVCGKSSRIGAFLPCNPLQMLLLKETGPLVMTSGNYGGEPIIIKDDDMLRLMKVGGVDIMLTHDREILTPLDDSIYQVNGSYIQVIRRARGLVPAPIMLKQSLNEDVFAAGGDLKAVFALGHADVVYLSQYFGDLEDFYAQKSRKAAIDRMEALLDVHPKVFVGDMHPAYVSSQGMQIKVQHHHAHMASVIAEHGLEGITLGFVFDGTGYGTDGTIWGSEFFIYKNHKIDRVGHFSCVKLLGGDAGSKNAYLTLLSYMLTAQEQGFSVDSFFEELKEKDITQSVEIQKKAWLLEINTAYASSMGRLFDAVAAVLDICHFNSYEGECAISLEQEAKKGIMAMRSCKDLPCPDSLHIAIKKEECMWVVDSVSMIAELYQLKKRLIQMEIREWKSILAYLFHHTIAIACEMVVKKVLAESDVDQIAFSGGCFQNRILLDEISQRMTLCDVDVYTNEQVPCGDGCIALGQIYLL